MQSNRQAQTKKGILDQKWVTYALALLLIVLIVVFAASLRYQDEIINFFKRLFRFGKEEKPQRPTIGSGKWEYSGILISVNPSQLIALEKVML